MASTMADDLVAVFRPFLVLYPLSITSATTSSDEKLHTRFAYRTYIALTVLVATFNSIWNIVNILTKQKLVVGIHLILAYWIYQIALVPYLLATSAKNKMRKLFAEINRLDCDLKLTDAHVMNKNIKNRYTYYSASLIVFHLTVGITDVYGFDRGQGRMFGAFPVVWVWNFMRAVADSETMCLACFLSILHSRVEYFVTALQIIVSTNTSKAANVYTCYMDILRIIKRINKIWKVQIFLVLTFEFYFTVGNTLAMHQRFYVNLKTIPEIVRFWVRLALIVRHLAIFLQYGMFGGQIGSQLDRIHGLAATIKDLPLREDLRKSCGDIMSIAKVCRPRLKILDTVEVTGRLPVLMCSAIATTTIVFLQLKIV